MELECINYNCYASVNIRDEWWHCCIKAQDDRGIYENPLKILIRLSSIRLHSRVSHRIRNRNGGHCKWVACAFRWVHTLNGTATKSHRHRLKIFKPLIAFQLGGRGDWAHSNGSAYDWRCHCRRKICCCGFITLALITVFGLRSWVNYARHTARHTYTHTHIDISGVWIFPLSDFWELQQPAARHMHVIPRSASTPLNCRYLTVSQRKCPNWWFRQGTRIRSFFDKGTF